MTETVIAAQSIEVPWWKRWHRAPAMQLLRFDSGRIAVVAWSESADVEVESGAVLKDVPGWVEVASVLPLAEKDWL